MAGVSYTLLTALPGLRSFRASSECRDAQPGRWLAGRSYLCRRRHGRTLVMASVIKGRRSAAPTRIEIAQRKAEINALNGRDASPVDPSTK